MTKLLFFLLLLLLPLASLVSVSASISFRAELTHVDAGGHYDKSELLRRAVLRSKMRAAALLSRPTVVLPESTAGTPFIPVRPSEGEFLVDVGIGTPAQAFSGIFDTGSDLIWTQCNPCILCAEQPTPYYDPAKSSTSSAVTCADPLCQALPGPLCYQNTCVYFYSYGDSAATAGYLAAETLTFGSANGTKVSAPSSIAFGCGSLNDGSLSNGSGVVGFGRGPLSLVNQLNAKKFAYCFTSFLASNSTSTLFFGAQAKLANNTIYGPVQSTAFVVNPALPSLFFVDLIGITVGDTQLPIPPSVFALSPDGSGGVFIDSGTSITYLQDTAYDLVTQAFLSQVTLQAVNDTAGIGLDVCFALPSPPFVTVDAIPKLVFHFGGGADMQLPQENYMAIDFDTGNLCLAMLGSSDGSVIGNFQQQNMQILYDLENNLLSFVPAQCGLM